MKRTASQARWCSPTDSSAQVLISASPPKNQGVAQWRSDYQFNRKANCMLRIGSETSKILPAESPPSIALLTPCERLVRLKALKTSQRNCILTASVTLKFLNRDQLATATPGARKELREALPNL